MVEGIPDRHEPQVVMDRWSRRSRQLPHDSASDDAKASKRRATKVTRTERKREKRQGCQRLDRKIPGTVGRQRPRSHAVDMSRPRSTRPTREKFLGLGWCPERSTEAVAGDMNHPFPRYYRMEPKTPWGAHAAKVATAGRERTRYEYTQFDWVAEVGWTRRASCPPGDRKVSW
jgi:hypothetical protein